MLSGFAFAPVAHAEVDRDFTEGDYELWEQECEQDLEADRPTAQVTGVSDSSARAATDAVIAGLADDQITLQVSQDLVAVDEVEVRRVITEGESFTSVTLPIAGEHAAPSNLSVLLGDNGEILQYAETLVDEFRSGMLEVTSYVDGELATQERSEVPHATDEQLGRTLSGESTQLAALTQSGQTTAQCIAVALGISVPAAAVIAVSCKGACAAAAVGVGVPFCLGCIGLTVTLSGTAGWNAINCF